MAAAALLLLGIVGLLLPAGPARAASFKGVGDLPGGRVESWANDVSGDGSVVTGYSTTGDGISGNAEQAFRWTSGGGMVGLGYLPGAVFVESSAWGVSRDGSIIVGASHSASGGEAFRWTAGGGMVALGDLAGGTVDAVGTSTSVDGSVIVGAGHSASGDEAFRWTSGGGMVGLGDLAGGSFFSSAVDVSSDGSVVVGYGRLETQNQAFRWTADGGMVGLPGFLNSAASGVSADGSVVVGHGTSALGIEAFRWTADGGMVGLGQLPNGFFYSVATDVSADGSVVVGAAGPSAGGPAFIWDAAHGMRSLQTVLVADYHLNLTGWNLGEATAISSDGTTIVGYGIHSGHSEGWVAVIPEPSTGLLFGAGVVALAAWARRRRR